MHSQTFPCDGTLLFSVNQERAPTQIYDVFFGPFGALSFGQKNIFRDGAFDALGFNPLDNYIYGVKSNTNEIVRLKADGTSESIGNVMSLDTLHASAGDCTPDGKYICHDRKLDQILVFDVVNEFANTHRIDLFWDPSSEFNGSFTARIDDIAIDPNDPNTAYTFQGDYNDPDLKPDEARGFLLRVNLDFNDSNVGMVTPIAKVTENVVSQMGTLFFSKDGGLFGYGADTRGFSSLQNRLVSINKFTGELRPFEFSGPGAIVTDGCSCPYSISFENVVSPLDVLCTNSEVTYDLTITNRFYQGFNNISIVDTLTEGMIIKSINGNFNGSVEEGTGLGSRIMKINGIQLPPRSTITISISAQVNDIGIELIPNQAHLLNLPQRLGSEMSSDDPGTVGFVGDATNIFGNPQVLDEFEISVTNPTDCLSPNDGKALFSSPVLISGEQYQLSLRDEEYEMSTFNVTIDEKNSFLLDSMPPGEYELRQITAQSSNCSFRMEDTTINIIAPNQMISASAQSNGPLCEDSNLELKGSMSPEGSIKWKGPLGYRSNEQNPTRFNVDTSQSGIYEMIATYGICEQSEFLKIDIAPQINASIETKDEYCERDEIQIIANGIGDFNTYQWTGPGSSTNSEKIFEFTSASLANEGEYRLIIDNGFCKDTTSTFIKVHPSPTLSLPFRIETNLCEALTLNPLVTGEDDVEYKWSQNENLSCSDCPNPEITFPILRQYDLQVNSAHSCKDSATVFVKFLTDKLLTAPNIFSPDSDGQNNQFKIELGCGVEAIKKLQIFDRSGSLVYEENPQEVNEIAASWDGTYKGKIIGSGVYVWQVDLLLSDGSTQQMIGDVTLIR